MTNKNLIFFALIVSALSSSALSRPAEPEMALAAKKGRKGVRYVQPWGMAGCGLSSVFIKDKDRGSQAFASILGITFNTTSTIQSQTSGISSGTSNCVELKPVFARQEQEVYVNTNLASLSREAAQGNGDHLRAFAEVLGCPHDEFSKMSQEKYEAIFVSYNPHSVLESFLREVKGDAHLAGTCTRAS